MILMFVYTVYVCCDIQKKIYISLLELLHRFCWNNGFVEPWRQTSGHGSRQLWRTSWQFHLSSSFGQKRKSPKRPNNRDGQMKTRESEKTLKLCANSLPNNSPWRWDSKCTYIKHPHAYKIIYVSRDLLYIFKKHLMTKSIITPQNKVSLLGDSLTE